MQAHHIIKLETLKSTNNYATNLLKTAFPEHGTVIVVENQTAGRGQRDNIWETEASKNLTFSMIAHHNGLLATEQFYLSMAISLAIIQYLNVFSSDIFVKWPNDIYYKNDKLAGILIENSLKGNKIVNSVIGIGLNVNQENFPAYLPHATSLKRFTGRDFELSLVLNALLEYIDNQLITLEKRNFHLLKQTYMKHLYRVGVKQSFYTAGKKIQARIIDVNRLGQLILQLENGATQAFNFNELKFIL